MAGLSPHRAHSKHWPKLARGPLKFIARHVIGDWGETYEENERSLNDDCRLMSVYVTDHDAFFPSIASMD